MLRRSDKYVRKRKKSFKTAIVLALMLAVMVIAITAFNKSGLPAGLASLINADYENFRNLEQFTEERAKEIQKHLAGFWTYSEGDPETSPVAKREYLEMIDNGMIWLVKEWTVNLPGGERHDLAQVVYGYFNPYSYSPDNSAYYNEVRTIRQVYIDAGDTCYGASQVDEIWQISKTEDGETLTLDRREYKKYTGEIKEFFPDGGLLDIVDLITLKACPAAAGLPFYAKRALVRSMPENPVAFFARLTVIDSLVRAYYRPIVLDELARKYDPRAVPDEMVMQLTISPEGAITDMKYKSAKLVTKRFDDLAVMDVRSWLFAPVMGSKEPQKIDLVIKVK